MHGIPSKRDARALIKREITSAQRVDRQRGTNCEGFELFFEKNGRTIKLYAKRGFVKGVSLERLESDYKLIKSHFRNIIPNQAFLQESGSVYVLAAPVAIKTDIFDSANRPYVLECLMTAPRLRKQLAFFIRQYKNLLEKGKSMDLYGKENLVISAHNTLHYIDSFEVFTQSPIVMQTSLTQIEYLEALLRNVRIRLQEK